MRVFSFNTLFAIAVACAVFCRPASARADFMLLPGSHINQNDTIGFHITAYEPSIAQIESEAAVNGGNYLFGVGVITQIVDNSTGQILWNAGGSQNLTFTFNNYLLDPAHSPGLNMDGTTNGNGSVAFTGGKLDVYFTNTAPTTIPPALGTNATPDVSGQFSGVGTTLEMVGSGVANANGDTLVATPQQPGVQTSLFPATGNGLVNINYNTLAHSALLDAFHLAPLLHLGTNSLTQNPNATAAQYGIIGLDPITGTAVPEPGTLAMLCSGVLAVGARFLRRRRQAA